MNIDRQTDANHNRRMANQSRAIDLNERRELEIERRCMIGELCREGKTVFYFFPAGGKYKESTSQTEIIDYIIRNKYVR